MFHKVVWRHMRGVAGFLIITLLQIYQRIFQWKKLKISSDFRELWRWVCVLTFWPTLYVLCYCLYDNNLSVHIVVHFMRDAYARAAMVRPAPDCLSFFVCLSPSAKIVLKRLNWTNRQPLNAGYSQPQDSIVFSHQYDLVWVPDGLGSRTGSSDAHGQEKTCFRALGCCSLFQNPYNSWVRSTVRCNVSCILALALSLPLKANHHRHAGHNKTVLSVSCPRRTCELDSRHPTTQDCRRQKIWSMNTLIAIVRTRHRCDCLVVWTESATPPIGAFCVWPVSQYLEQRTHSDAAPLPGRLSSHRLLRHSQHCFVVSWWAVGLDTR